MPTPKVEVHAIPDLVQVDREIRRLNARIGNLERMIQMALRQGGPGWVTQVGNVALQLEKVVDTMARTVERFNSIKARFRK